MIDGKFAFPDSAFRVRADLTVHAIDEKAARKHIETWIEREKEIQGECNRSDDTPWEKSFLASGRVVSAMVEKDRIAPKEFQRTLESVLSGRFGIVGPEAHRAIGRALDEAVRLGSGMPHVTYRGMTEESWAHLLAVLAEPESEKRAS